VADKSNAQRLIDLKAALKAAKKTDTVSLADCAALWGVTKPRFVNKRAEIANFPEGTPGKGNSLDYPAIAALKSMIAHLERHQRAQDARVSSQLKLLGRSADAQVLAQHTPQELVHINRLGADLEARERSQGLYTPVADQQQIAGEVFSELSEFCSTLSNQIDPHGKLAPEIRTTIDSKAREALLKLHAKLKGLLSGDALHPGTGTPDRGSGKPPARRKSKRGLAVEA
jgi:hypothetical protein